MGLQVALHALEFGAHVSRGLVAQLGIFFERAADHLFEFQRDRRIERGGARGIAIENLVEDHAAGGAGEGLAAGGEFVEHQAEAEKVAARVELFAAYLLGRHVGDRAWRGAGAGEVAGGVLRSVLRHGVAGRALLLELLGEAKVENFRLAALGDENVGGLDVAMDDAFGVCGVERVGDLDADFELSSVLSAVLEGSRRCLRVMPRRSSMAMKGAPSTSPMS